jgi:hypothetical protein
MAAQLVEHHEDHHRAAEQTAVETVGKTGEMEPLK